MLSQVLLYLGLYVVFKVRLLLMTRREKMSIRRTHTHTGTKHSIAAKFYLNFHLWNKENKKNKVVKRGQLLKKHLVILIVEVFATHVMKNFFIFSKQT